MCARVCVFVCAGMLVRTPALRHVHAYTHAVHTTGCVPCMPFIAHRHRWPLRVFGCRDGRRCTDVQQRRARAQHHSSETEHAARSRHSRSCAQNLQSVDRVSSPRSLNMSSMASRTSGGRLGGSCAAVCACGVHVSFLGCWHAPAPAQLHDHMNAHPETCRYEWWQRTSAAVAWSTRVGTSISRSGVFVVHNHYALFPLLSCGNTRGHNNRATHRPS